MNEKILLLSSLFSIVLIVVLAEAFEATCEAGGPYIKNSTIINVIGNVTNNSLGANANVTINISKSGVLKANRSTTADSSGKYFASFNDVLDVGTYDVNVSVQRLDNTIVCNDTVEIYLSSETITCQNRVIAVDGYALYSDTGQPVTSGTAFVTILDKNVGNKTSLTSSGTFSVGLSACLILGNRYTIVVVVEDNSAKRSWLHQTFVVY